MIKIFIADDFQILRDDLKETIESQDDMCVVGTASSGKEALSLLPKLMCDIALMDIEMEEINSGILASEKLHEQLPDLRIIFLTAHETDQMIITAMGAGASDYIVKGVSEQEILKHIRSVYEGKSILDSRIQKIVIKEYTRARRSEQSLLYFINNLSTLTTTERELVKLLLTGKKVQEIAKIRCVELVTIKTQIKGLLRKFRCSRTKDIVKLIHDLNLEHLF